MIEMVDVVEVKALDDWRLWLRFSDGGEGVWNISDVIDKGGAMVEPLRDPAFFRRVYLSFGVPTWPNGFDLDAINLHRQMAAEGLLRKPAA